MRIDENTANGIGVALNEASFLGAEYDSSRNIVSMTFAVLTLPDAQSPEPADSRRVVILTDIGRIAAALRASLWDDLSAQTVSFEASDLLSVVESFGGQPVYGWEFVNNDDPSFVHWKDRLSLDITPQNGALENHIMLFQEGYRNNQEDVTGASHLDLWIWFADLLILDTVGNRIAIADFIADGQRWWDALYAEDPRTHGHGMYVGGVPQGFLEDPPGAVVERVIREEINKPTGELTKADLEKITDLSLFANQLTDVTGLEKLTQLKELNLCENQLTDVTGLENLTNLTLLNLGSNQLTDVKGLENLTQLTYLRLDGNQLTDVKGLENLTQLTYLRLEGNQLTDVKGLEKLTQLTYLRLDGNQLTSVKGLKKLTRLTELHLASNQLADVKGLEKLMKLTRLTLRRNQLTDVKGLEKLTQLTWLMLQNNKLTDVTGLEKLTKLTRLSLEINPDLTKAQIDELQKALPNCKISFY